MNLALTSGQAESDHGYVAHEWGTFTCVQGGNGVPLAWHSVQIAELPKLVYNWFRPGLQRDPIAGLASGKGGIISLQRMETPVIYFYSDRSKPWMSPSVFRMGALPNGIRRLLEWDRVFPLARMAPHRILIPHRTAGLNGAA